MLVALFAAIFAAPASSAPETPQSPPSAVTDAIAASPAPASPAEVIVGAYINDIQELDFKANNYVVDLYVWFRWKTPDTDPSKTMEFMNCLVGWKRAGAPEAETYSRIVLSIPVTRPIVAMSIKTFVLIMLIVVCAGLIFFVRPRYIEGRIGLGITALLTLVALQLASGGSLPDVDYLMMLDKIYLLAYLFIIIALGRVVATSWLSDDVQAEKAISRTDRIFAVVLLAAYFAANIAIAWDTLAATT